MLRGGVSHLAAFFLVGLCGPVMARAQAPVRTRDASFALIEYETGLTAGALTLYDAVFMGSDRSTRSGYTLLSIFDDGRVSMQGGLEASRRTAALPVTRHYRSLFTAIRGEVLIDAATTIQTGFMPTAALSSRARMRFEHADQGGHAELAVTRAFDGRFWQTVVSAEARAWMRRGPVFAGLRSTPMQLGVGDMLADNEAELEWTAGRGVVSTSLGIRLGEAERATKGWGAMSVSWPVFLDSWATFSIGKYPADLIQNLPAGRYVAFALKLPNGRLPAVRRPPPPPPPPRPRIPDVPVNFRIAMVTGPAYDSTHIREVRVWAPGAQVVELVADFADWIPVPLVRRPNGEWQGFYHIAPGLHRVNIRIDGTTMEAPQNWPLDKDEFLGTVALVLVRG
jgi:hypothetical protein